jgi:hypothetical protein
MKSWKKDARIRTAIKAAAAKDMPRTPEEHAAVQEVFAAWQRLFGYAKEGLTSGRRAVILARLREEYTVEQIVAVLTWASSDPWTRGQELKSTRAYDDLTAILQRAKFGERLLWVTHQYQYSSLPRTHLMISPT